MYIYIYIERERERGRYRYKEREREREKESQWERREVDKNCLKMCAQSKSAQILACRAG